jgi:hypothetical protein
MDEKRNLLDNIGLYDTMEDLIPPSTEENLVLRRRYGSSDMHIPRSRGPVEEFNVIILQ